MANVQSPPGFLSISELFIAIKTRPFEFEPFMPVDVNDSGYKIEDGCTMYETHDAPDIAILEHHFKEKKYPVKIKFAYILFTLHDNGKDHQSLKIGTCVKEYLDEDALLKDIMMLINRHRCRDLLSGKYLKTYVLYNYAYHELPAKYWSYDENWYRLLLDGCAQGNTPSLGDFLGSVYFKTEDAERCASIFPNRRPAMSYFPSTNSSLINLETYTTPWLQVLAAVYDEYGKDGLAQASKDSVVIFIREYIEKHKLDIAKTDAPDLAKFMRLAEQKAGKKYHAELKLKKLHK